MASVVQRAVFVYRTDEYTELVQSYGSVGQANFMLAAASNNLSEVAGGKRLRSIQTMDEHHEQWSAQQQSILNAIPVTWRRATVERDSLSRFLFEPDDIIVVFGQDGLVANVAKYINGQPVIGLNPDPAVNPGILVPHLPESAEELIAKTAENNVVYEDRSMVQATTNDGRKLYALNEIFIGHRSHQSARYHISYLGYEEDQSSSGLIVSTGTGATGWAKSIYESRRTTLPLPSPTQPRLVFFVREAWPSPGTSTEITEGVLDTDQLEVTSRLNNGGVVFGDGIEKDYVVFDYGMIASVGLADRKLRLVK